jgi:predicted regulator of Ras-like GTPase activity (Roadblock/LC7/MglB family)
MELKRPADSAQRLEDILYFAPGDEAILELLKKARESAGQPYEPKRSSSDLKATSDRGGKQTSIMRAVKPQKQQSDRDRALNAGIANVRTVEGVTGAILVDQYGLVVAADLDASLDEGLAGALITNIYRTTSSNSLKLSVGSFEEGVVEGENGNIHILQIDDMILAVFAKSEVKMGLLEKTIRDFAMTVEQSR